MQSGNPPVDLVIRHRPSTPLSAGHCPGKEVTQMSKIKVGRSAVTGRFTTVAKATRYSKTHVVETIKRK